MKAPGEIDRIAGGPRCKAATSSIAALPPASTPFAAAGTVAASERSRASRLHALTDRALDRLEEIMSLQIGDSERLANRGVDVEKTTIVAATVVRHVMRRGYRHGPWRSTAGRCGLTAIASAR